MSDASARVAQVWSGFLSRVSGAAAAKVIRLKKAIGSHVRLQPAAVHLDFFGSPLPERDEPWRILDVDQAGVQLETVGAAALLELDAVHRFDADAGRLVLDRQVFIRGGAVTYRPCVRSGERVELTAPLAAKAATKQPRRPSIEEQLQGAAPGDVVDVIVDDTYPKDSGLGARMWAELYRIRWAAPASEGVDGWEVLLEEHDGVLVRLHKGEIGRQVLMKKKLSMPHHA